MSSGSQKLSHIQSKQQAPGSANLLFKINKFERPLQKASHVKFWIPHQPIQLNTKIHNHVHVHMSHIKRKGREKEMGEIWEREIKGWGRKKAYVR